MNISKPHISKALAPYEPYYERILPTGSRVMVDPPPTDTDRDFLVLCTSEQKIGLEALLHQDGWLLGGSLPNIGIDYDDWHLNTEHEYKELPDGSHVIDCSRVFHSWKRPESPGFHNGSSEDILAEWVPDSGPEINLLVTCNDQYFQDFTRATFLCQALNLKDKADRVTVFEALTRDVWPPGRKKKDSRLFKWNMISKDYFGIAVEAAQLQQAQVLVNPPIVAQANPDGVDLGPGISTPPLGWWSSYTTVAMH